MLNSLTIKNIALISSLNLDFSDGLCCLSGETGAGKSIIIDALSFVLGERADKTLIKYGEQQAFVEVVFSQDSDSTAVAKLREFGLPDDEVIVISRTLNLMGKNECRINGRVVSPTVLREISSCLVDIFGQSQHLNLFKTDTHLSTLDAFAHSEKFTSSLANLSGQLSSTNREMKVFGGDNAQRERMLDILLFQIDEIKKANLSQAEEDKLVAQKTKIINMEKIANALSGSISALSGEIGSISALNTSISSLSTIEKLDKDISQLYDRLKQSRIELDDIASSLESFLEQTDFNPQEIERVESRLEQYKSLKRKYGGSVQSCLDFLSDAEEQFYNLSNAQEKLDKLQAQKDKLLDQMYYTALNLSIHRKENAKLFEREIEAQLNDLGMKNTTFCVDFSVQPTRSEYFGEGGARGFDKIEFLMSANKGQPLKPLTKVISGGEMSRFMLAIKNITATLEKIPTMVFDEIDAGISGTIAQMMAVKLSKVSRDYQTIVITHLAQVAAIADTNLLITKSVVDDNTQTEVTLLDGKGKQQEVARLSGGENIGQYSLLHAKELIDWANGVKAKK